MKSFEYAKKRSEKKRNANRKKWWIINTKNYSVYIWALPLLPFVLIHDKISDYCYKRRVWNEETARKVLNHALPYILEWVEEDNAYYYCMDWGNSSLWEKAPITKRKWARKFAYDLQRFIKEGYENPNYAKSVENDGYDTWVKFEPLQDKFPLNV